MQCAQLGYGPGDVVLHDVDLEVRRGDFLGVVGPNGSGKTTLLRTLLGLLRPVSGAVRRTGEAELAIGYVPQRETVDTIYPIPVGEIVLMGRYGRIGPLRRPTRRDREIARECMARTGILDRLESAYSELSGGQRQRVLIARALATEPDILVLDEPTHGLDLASETSLLALFRCLHQSIGLTVVIVSHLLGSVADSATRIAIITDGRIEVGPREEMLTGERLSRLYGMPVRVLDIEGHVSVVAKSGRPEGAAP